MQHAARATDGVRACNLLVCVLACSLAVSCDAGPAITDAAPQARLRLPELSLDVPSAALLPGESITLSATLRDATGSVLQGEQPAWTSSDSLTLHVSSSGVLTAFAPGSAIITATIDGNSAQATVVVVFARVTADFATTRTGARSASGVVNGAGPLDPPGTQIAPLRLGLWRGSQLDHAYRMAAHATHVEFIIGSAFGDPVRRWPLGRPYDNWTAYEEFVRQRAAATRGRRFIYDVWNEPDNKHSWDGTDAKFFETYLRTFHAVRSELGPDAEIAGPSIGRYDPEYLTRFLEYCLANRCEVNVLTWHEFGGGGPLASIVEHAQAARRMFVDNPRYAPLKLRAIHISEMIGSSHALNPAASLMYMRHAEAGGADAAARACWLESGHNTCTNRTLGGLLTPQSYQPRAVWWLHRYYGEGALTRVASSATDARVVALASRAAPDPSAAQVLVGYTDAEDPAAPGVASLGVVLDHLDRLAFMPGAPAAHIEVRKIPASGAVAVPSLETVLSRDVDVNEGSASLVIDHAEVNAVYVITITAALADQAAGRSAEW